MPLKMRFSAIEGSPDVSWKKVYETKDTDAFSFVPKKILLRASNSLHLMQSGRDHGVFSKVTGGRPSSFQGVMDGGPPGPLVRAGTGRGSASPVRNSLK